MAVQQFQVAALIIALISVIGVTCNCFVLITIQRAPRMANSFGRISASLAAFEALMLAIFVFYYTPMVFFDIEALKKYSFYCGGLLLGCFQVAVYGHVLISLNRFCAIFFPLHYSRVFTLYTTTAYIALILLAVTIATVFIYILGHCRFMYFDDYWRFGFDYTPNCPTIPFPTNAECFATCLFIVFLLDFAAIYRVRMYNKGIAKGNLNKCWNSRRKKEEINFLKQASLRASLFAVGLIMYYVLPYYFANVWVKFLFGPVTWVSEMTADGLIIIIYNRDIRYLCRRAAVRTPTKNIMVSRL